MTFKKYHFGPPKKCVFGFWRKPPKTIFFFVFRLWFSFKNNRHKSVLLIGIFENAQKSYWPPKTPFWPFLAVNSGFLCVKKNIDQNNICVSISNVLKAKTEKKLVDPKKGHFWVLNKNCKKNFFRFFFYVHMLIFMLLFFFTPNKATIQKLNTENFFADDKI